MEEKLEYYLVSLYGCDDVTRFIITIRNEDELNLLEKLSELSIKNSTYQCMPVLKYSKGIYVSPKNKGEINKKIIKFKEYGIEDFYEILIDEKTKKEKYLYIDS